jgi:hypothetical protein
MSGLVFDERTSLVIGFEGTPEAITRKLYIPSGTYDGIVTFTVDGRFG